jgi:hypothetical protein
MKRKKKPDASNGSANTKLSVRYAPDEDSIAARSVAANT